MKYLMLAFFIVFNVCALASETLPTAMSVDINQYVGKWYAITSLPQSFTRKCVAQTAEYEILSAQSISVINTCIKKDGSTKSITGVAVVKNTKTNAELEVTFNSFWTKLFRVKGDYTIIKLDQNYSTVLIGSKNRKSLWLLSRSPYLNEDVKNEYITFATLNGFDTSLLVDSKF